MDVGDLNLAPYMCVGACLLDEPSSPPVSSLVCTKECTGPGAMRDYWRVRDAGSFSDLPHVTKCLAQQHRGVGCGYHSCLFHVPPRWRLWNTSRLSFTTWKQSLMPSCSGESLWCSLPQLGSHTRDWKEKQGPRCKLSASDLGGNTAGTLLRGLRVRGFGFITQASMITSM